MVSTPNSGSIGGIAEAGQGTFHPVEEWVLGESAQLGQRLG